MYDPSAAGARDHRLEGDPSTTVRRFRGPVADELFVLCRPGEGRAAPARQAEVVYEALIDALAAEGVGPEAVVAETVFLRHVRGHLDPVRSVRSRVLGEARHPAPTFIGQPPLREHALLEVAAMAVRPRPTCPWAARDVRRAAACRCAACARGIGARIVRQGDQISLYAGNIHGSGRGASEEAADMFRVAEGLLADADLGFADVLRTWIHVRDIRRDYAALNEARRDFFRRRGLDRRPASTGVQGVPVSDVHGFSLSLYAAKRRRGLDVAAMSTPLLNEAWSYGADFSRGLRVAEANKVSLYVSGTASIDEAGRSVHVGHGEAQAERMLRNVASLLARHGATLDDVVSGVAYLKHPTDAAPFRALLRRRRLDRFPCALVAAPLCRRELLCEAEVVAMLPPTAAGA
ncbi:MAG TPA: Rid family hydrolase [Candidatus Binatia bacterium]|nr:Rid family hydrolase [Candidatus Binatia bacterium]